MTTTKTKHYKANYPQSHDSRRDIYAHSVGTRALATLMSTSVGTVLAAFERSVYLDFGDDRIKSAHNVPQLLCIGSAIGDGPIHLVVSNACLNAVAKSIEVGQTVDVCWPRIMFKGRGNTVCINVEEAKHFTACAVARGCAVGTMTHLKKFYALTARPVFSAPGLSHPSVMRVTQRAIASLKNWFLVENHLDQSNHINSLIGAGMGLTPAGDDLLSGYLGAVHNISVNRETDQKKQLLLQTVRSALPSRTNRISAAHVHCAINNQLTYSNVKIIKYLSQPYPLSTKDALKLGRIVAEHGATSGFDWVAGYGLGAQALSAIE